jgi:DnaJ-class molecular chaperone
LIISNNEEEVAEMWGKIQFSYSILMDSRQRKRYDRNEMLVDPGAAIRRAAVGATLSGVSYIGKGILNLGSHAFNTILSQKEVEEEEKSQMK